RNAPALQRPGHDKSGLIPILQSLLISFIYFLQVVPINFNRMPAEGSGSLSISFAIPAQLSLSALTQAVHVKNGDQVVQLAVARVIKGLPHRPLSHLAVSQKDPNSIGEFFEMLAHERDAHSDGNPLTERSGGNIDPRNDRSRMTLETTAKLAKAHH